MADTSYTIDLDPNLEAKLFPDFTEGRFTVSKEERQDLWEKTKEEYGAFSLEQGSQYQTQLGELEKSKLDSKINHISAVLGEPIENVGMTNKMDMAIVADLSRNKYFQTRQKKFLSYYPNGSYQQIEINVGGNETDLLEIFKYDSSKKGWKIANPYGRDINEFGKVAGHLFTLPLVGDIAALASKKVKALAAIPMTARVMIANWLGLKGDKAIEYARGFGENEFADATDLTEVNWKNFATDVGDYASAAISGGLYKGFDAISQWFVKGKKPGMVDLGPDMVKAAEALGLKPLVYAQVVANPIVRRMFTQSGEFVTIPGTLQAEQAQKLIKVLKKFGISDKTQKQIAKNIAEGTPDKNIVSLQQVIDLQDSLKLKLADSMKTFNNDLPTLSSQKVQIDEVLDNLNVAMRATKNTLTNKVFGKKKVGFKTGVSNIDGAFVNLRDFRLALNRELKGFKTNVVKHTDETTMNVKGEIIPAKPQKKGYSEIPEEFRKIKKIIDDMLAIPKNKQGEVGFDVGTLTQIKDKNMDGLKALFKMRKDLHDITLNSKDSEVIATARALHEQLVKTLDNNIGGGDAFKSSMKLLNAHTKDMEAVKHLSFMKDALGKAGDPDAFVQKFMTPGSPIKLDQLKGMLMHGSLKDAEKEAGEAAFNILRKRWFSNIFRNADDTTLNKWVTDDPDGLKLLLGDGWKKQVKTMREIIDYNKRIQSGVTTELQLGTNTEFAESIIKKSKQKGKVGLDREFNVILEDLGGIDGPGAEMLRNQIINRMLKLSHAQIKKGKEMFGDTIIPKMLKKEINDLQANPYLIKFFNKEHIQALQNFNLYTMALAGAPDVGAVMAAGAQAKSLTDGIFHPPTLMHEAFSIFKHDIIARILSKNQTATLLNKMNLDNAISQGNLDIINAIMAELAKDVLSEKTGIGQADDKGISGTIDADLISSLTNRKSMTNVAEDSGMASSVPIAFNRPNGASRMAKAPVVNPAGMFGTPTGSAGADTYAQGQQLFGKNPREITFANQGGIMSTNKAFQRVA